jgi:hypothetical protein
MARELHYRQVYMSPERGWIPLDAAEIGRRKYGDCKDLSCFLMTQAKQLGAEVRPALARIMAGEVEPDEPPSLEVFNHVIAAIRLDHSLGFAAEVDTPRGRFLLIDPTDRFTPLGLLGEAHRGGRVLICTPEGGLWVPIPPSAIHRSAVRIRLRGEVDGKGALKASMMIGETGDAWGMRAVAQTLGAKQLRDYVLGKLVDLPPTATLEIIKMGDPMDLDRPFSTEIELRHPEGFRRSGDEATLASLGWRILPSQAQKPGIPRRYPLTQNLGPELDYTAEIQVPYRCAPVLPSMTSSSPFRAYSWEAVAGPEGAGTRLTLKLRHESKQVFFDFDRREEGVSAAKKDRSQAKNLLADALAFKVTP